MTINKIICPGCNKELIDEVNKEVTKQFLQDKYIEDITARASSELYFEWNSEVENNICSYKNHTNITLVERD